MLRVESPVFVCFLVVTVSTEVPDCTTEAGLKVAVTNLGAPLTDRFTVPENPDAAAMETEYVVLPLRPTVRLAGVTEIEKSPATLTTSVTIAECTTAPLVPVIVSG